MTRTERAVERNTAIVRDYLAGVKTAEIAKRYGIYEPSIYPILHRRGIPVNRGGSRYERDQETRDRTRANMPRRPQHPAVTLRLAGYRPIAISRHLSMKIKTVESALGRWRQKNRDVAYPPLNGKDSVGPNEPA